MTNRQRLLDFLAGKKTDCVPVCPDISNMVPCRLTGKPFWDIYLYKDPPLWKAHIDAIRKFDIDGGFELYDFGDLFGDETHEIEERLVLKRPDGSLVTRRLDRTTGEWSDRVTLYTADNPPADVSPDKLGLPAVPSEHEKIEGIKKWPKGLELWNLIRKEMGDSGIVAMPSGGTTLVVNEPEQIYEFYDNPEKYYAKRDRLLDRIDRYMKIISGLAVKPDLLFCGASGSLVWQSPDMFRELALPVLKKAAEKAAELGIPTHVHSCGPEKELVRMAVENTKLSIIDPLEIPPMGDCDLAELKRLYGDKIVLKGNLHTTEVMLKGSVDDVIRASKKAIDDAGKGGKFILSTGDQCGRDTPDANLFAMVETARTYGRYK